MYLYGAADVECCETTLRAVTHTVLPMGASGLQQPDSTQSLTTVSAGKLVLCQAQGTPEILFGGNCSGDTQNALYGRTADREWAFATDQ